jgi:hypothetical protein
VTRGNINGQLKATAMFASFGGLFPEASAAHPDQPSGKAYIYESKWLREQKEREANQQSNPAIAQEEEEPALPSAEPVTAAAPDALDSVLDPGPISDPPRLPDTRIPTFAELASSRFTSFVPDTASGPDLRVPFSIDKTRFGYMNRFRNRR